MNPLLENSDLIAFDRIQAAHIEPAITQLLQQAQEGLEAICTDVTHPNWSNTVTALDLATAPLSRAWTAAGHLLSVVHQPELREAYNKMLPQVSAFWIALGARVELFERYQKMATAPDSLSSSQQKLLQDALKSFTLSGVALPAEQRAEFTQLHTQLAESTQKFSENVLDATDHFALHIEDPAELSGIPANTLSLFADAAQESGISGWKITLHMPSYLPVMQYADHRPLREKLYRAYSVRASEQADDPAFDNSTLLGEILRLRLASAHLLDYANYADVQLQTRMAQNVATVEEFLNDMSAKALPAAQADLKTLQQFAAQHCHLDHLEPWDIPYVSEKLREHAYAYSEQEVKDYFPVSVVLPGFFALIQRLFGVSLHYSQAPVWHTDVQVVEIRESGERIGLLYLDLFARTGKESGAWVNQDRSRWEKSEHVEFPIAYLTCNFTPPTEQIPSTLTHDDLITLFHEMGHALHLLLSKVKEPSASPFSSVEWDAIELPSQFMENFCWNYEVLHHLSGHYATSEKLPRSLFEKMFAAKNFQSGMRLVRQLEFALTDIELHRADQSAYTCAEALVIMRSVRAKVAVVHPPIWHRMLHSFTHIFAGGYAAGYYSYLWAEVLSSDAYALFEEHAEHEDTVIPNIGDRFKREILAVGGERSAMDSFVAYRGRKPTLDAFLRHNGLDHQ